jgi:hypothetical protein
MPYGAVSINNSVPVLCQGSNRSQAGDWLIFRSVEGRKMCLSPLLPSCRENWDSPRERLRQGVARIDVRPPRKSESRVATIARLSGCAKHKRLVKNLPRLRRPR